MFTVGLSQLSFSKMPNPSCIPQHVEQIILPAKNMSVVDFLDFKIPLVTFLTKLVKAEDYF